MLLPFPFVYLFHAAQEMLFQGIPASLAQGKRSFCFLPTVPYPFLATVFIGLSKS